tara:strand:+ start:4076 stop:5248 length:1173 start_codon:yes stop_codon:yes gene_type:complete
MAQAADYVIADGTGTVVLADINAVLSAISTNNAGTGDPAVMYPYMWYVDTSNNLIKMRNAANNAWVTIRSTDGVLTIPEGTVGTPGFRWTNDSNTGFFQPTVSSSLVADNIAVATNGTQRALFDALGNFYLGAPAGDGSTTIPTVGPVDGSTDATTPVFSIKGSGGNNNTSGAIALINKDQSSQGAEIYNSGEDGGLVLKNTNNEGISFRVGTGTSAAKRAAITTSGAFIIPDATTPSDTSAGVRLQSTATGSSIFSVGATASETTLIEFINTNGTVGTIKVSGSATSFNTSSDYRLKENEVEISDGITRLKQLKPYRFNFKANAGQTLDGFFAHEVQAIVPDAVSGTKDGVEMQGIDQSKLVPLLSAALKEAVAKIETLETKVAALEAG